MLLHSPPSSMQFLSVIEVFVSVDTGIKSIEYYFSSVAFCYTFFSFVFWDVSDDNFLKWNDSMCRFTLGIIVVYEKKKKKIVHAAHGWIKLVHFFNSIFSKPFKFVLPYNFILTHTHTHICFTLYYYYLTAGNWFSPSFFSSSLHFSICNLTFILCERNSIFICVLDVDRNANEKNKKKKKKRQIKP